MSILERLNDELAESARAAQRGVVTIRNRGGGTGAGTVWHQQGLIVTNAHVVREDSPTVLLGDGREFRGRVISRDDESDLAAISIPVAGLETLEPGTSTDLRPGQWVFSVGHPWGVAGSVTAGVVIGLETVDPRGGPSRDWIAVSLHLRPGYSGGPLMDSSGRLIGVNTMMQGPDVGVAIPVHAVKRFLKQAIAA